MTKPLERNATTSDAIAAAGIEIAVLDHSGVIESVNAAWEQFSVDNGGSADLTGVGINYLDVCDQAGSEPGAVEVGSAIRQALAGDLAAAVTARIPCHSAAEHRWFDVLVSARHVEDGDECGATIILTPVAEPVEVVGDSVPSASGLRSDDVAARPLSDVPSADGAVAWAMVEASPDALVMADEHGVIELVNGQAEKLFGYDRMEMLGRPVEMLLPEALAQPHAAHRTRFRVSPEVRSMGSGLDLRARRADGVEIPVEVSLSPLQVQGELRVIAAVRDVSERVAAEAQQHLIQRTIDAVHDGVFMFPADGDMAFTYVNQGAIDQVGYSREEFLAMTPLHIKPEYTRARFLEAIEPLISGEVQRLVLQTVHRRKDGHDVPVEIVLEYPAATDAAPQRFMVALVRDISDHLEAAEKMHRSEARFRAAFNDGPVPMTVAEVSPTADRLIAQANQAMADLVGYTTDELVGMSVTDFGHPDDLEADDQATAAQTAGHQEAFSGRKRYIHKDGSVIWVQLHVQVLSRDDDRITTIANSINISAEVEAERQRAQNQAALEALSAVRSSLLSEAPIADTLHLICARTRDLIAADTVLFSQPDSTYDAVHVVAYSALAPGNEMPTSFSNRWTDLCRARRRSVEVQQPGPG